MVKTFNYLFVLLRFLFYMIMFIPALIYLLIIGIKRENELFKKYGNINLSNL